MLDSKRGDIASIPVGKVPSFLSHKHHACITRIAGRLNYSEPRSRMVLAERSGDDSLTGWRSGAIGLDRQAVETRVLAPI